MTSIGITASLSNSASGLNQALVERFIDGRRAETRTDWVVVEQPLEIRIAGEPIATTMRTPGQDEELVAGFLLSEGFIGRCDELGAIRHCGEANASNIIDALPAPGVVLDIERISDARRTTVTSAACGLCGRQQIEDLIARCRPVVDETTFAAQIVGSMTDGLREWQHNFQRTGGLHAAGLCRADGSYVLLREDIGRHNAVDKVMGRRLLDGAVPTLGQALVVSGRVSFEIIQKALTGGVPLVVAVSAPSSLAINAAELGGVSLVAFARQGNFNVYTHPERIIS